jgi:hypothetical protein
VLGAGESISRVRAKTLFLCTHSQASRVSPDTEQCARYVPHARGFHGHHDEGLTWGPPGRQFPRCRRDESGVRS